MSVESRYRMSQERLEELKKELEYLQTVREKEVSEQIKEARSFGDLSENSEYDEAKTEQGKLYSKIAEIKNLIILGRISDESPLGRSLMGKKKGGRIEFEAPGGVIYYEILNCEN